MAAESNRQSGDRGAILLALALVPLPALLVAGLGLGGLGPAWWLRGEVRAAPSWQYGPAAGPEDGGEEDECPALELGAWRWPV